MHQVTQHLYAMYIVHASDADIAGVTVVLAADTDVSV